LGGNYKQDPLNLVADYAISESDLMTVQSFIRSLFVDLVPSNAHNRLPTFDWYGLATTNYDMLVEDAYRNARGGQSLRPMIEDSDRVDENLRSSRNVLYIKLHGCISRINNPECPLILTTDQYIEHRKGRARLFDVFRTWGYEHPIIFVGQSLQDSDLRAVIGELTGSLGETRPRYYMVAPDADDVRTRFWETKKITTLKGDFDTFMSSLDAAIPVSFRGMAIAASIEREHEIERKFRLKTHLSKSALQFLEDDVLYMNALTSTERIRPEDFYKGYSLGFGAIEQDLDVRRTLGDSILADHVLKDPEQLQDGLELILVKAHAGSGKSVLLKRIAWEAAKVYERIALFLRPQGIVNVSALKEIITNCQQRVYLFIDNAAERMREIQAIAKNIGPEGRLLTLVLAERTNEWNNQGQAVSTHVTNEYELRYLSMQEIDKLLALLETHRALGTLQRLGPEERKAAFAERAGRQLLVALHEATYGRPFEDIIVDEFHHIQPYEAQRLYLTVCVLNRLKVPVRAGIIARIHGIRFEEFREKFFSPLEHVVFAELDQTTRDYTYRSRHPHIADIVFQQVLANDEERFDLYIRCLKTLNIAYSADRKAFWQMVRGRTLLELFPDHQKVTLLYAAAKELVGEDAHLLHQMALYEAYRPNGKHQEAVRLLTRAAELAPYDVTIKHSAAELKLKFIDDTSTPLERATSLKTAAAMARDLLLNDRADAPARHTLIKIGIRSLRDSLEGDASNDLIEKQVKDLEEQLFNATQMFPGDSYLLESESELATLLSDHTRALTAMEKAFSANPRNAYIALRLAQVHGKRGDATEARAILEKGLAANNSEKRLHFALSEILMKEESTPNDQLIYHLRRSFTDGDSNFTAQLLYGRELFKSGEIEASRQVFAKLSKAAVPHPVRTQLLYPLAGQSTGRVVRLESTYGFIVRDGVGDTIFLHVSNTSSGLWKTIATGDKLRFSIAFTFSGPSAFDVELEGYHEPQPGQLDLMWGVNVTASQPEGN
jgi:tetratricopeptide (TPR) repeat protein